MITVNVHEAKTNLSRLLAQAEAGEDVVIARNGKPVARIVCVQKHGKRQFGSMTPSALRPGRRGWLGRRRGPDKTRRQLLRPATGRGVGCLGRQLSVAATARHPCVLLVVFREQPPVATCSAGDCG